MIIDIKIWYYEHEGVRKSFTNIFDALVSYTKEPYYTDGMHSNVQKYEYQLEFDYYDKI